jgi:hypothetical protein
MMTMMIAMATNAMTCGTWSVWVDVDDWAALTVSVTISAR